jgi:hypothetical protein
MDSTILLIAAGSALVVGTGLGIYIGALFAERRIQRAGHEAWLSAERFYKRAYKLTPRN